MIAILGLMKKESAKFAYVVQSLVPKVNKKQKNCKLPSF